MFLILQRLEFCLIIFPCKSSYFYFASIFYLRIYKNQVNSCFFCYCRDLMISSLVYNEDHKMKMKKHCRLWWPRQLLSNQESSSSILLGWFVTCSPSSLDIVVAFTCSEVLLSSSTPAIEVYQY